MKNYKGKTGISTYVLPLNEKQKRDRAAYFAEQRQRRGKKNIFCVPKETKTNSNQKSFSFFTQDSSDTKTLNELRLHCSDYFEE